MRVFILTILCFSFLFSHKLNLFTKYKNDSLYVNVFFPNGKGCQSCKIIIKQKDKTILENKTDLNGEFRTNLSLNSFFIIVDAGSGHIIKKEINRLKEASKIKETTKTKKIYNESKEIEKLKEENEKLKQKIEILEEKLDYFEVIKLFVGLGLIALIFVFLKRRNSEN